MHADARSQRGLTVENGLALIRVHHGSLLQFSFGPHITGREGASEARGRTVLVAGTELSGQSGPRRGGGQRTGAAEQVSTRDQGLAPRFFASLQSGFMCPMPSVSASWFWTPKETG
ncbi:MAG: hypothetical protein ACQESR_20925 [Planctomycetota bacterium]